MKKLALPLLFCSLAIVVFGCGDGNLVTYSYSANGGSGAPAAQTKTRNVLLRLSSTVPAREGYTFAGWNTEAGGGGTSYASGSIYTSNVSVTFYAQWKLILLNCDGLTFKTIAIGEQVWMAENLNCNWATAMALPSSCNYDFCESQINTPHQGICPSGRSIRRIRGSHNGNMKSMQGRKHSVNIVNVAPLPYSFISRKQQYTQRAWYS